MHESHTQKLVSYKNDFLSWIVPFVWHKVWSEANLNRTANGFWIILDVLNYNSAKTNRYSKRDKCILIQPLLITLIAFLVHNLFCNSYFQKHHHILGSGNETCNQSCHSVMTVKVAFCCHKPHGTTINGAPLLSTRVEIVGDSLLRPIAHLDPIRKVKVVELVSCKLWVAGRKGGRGREWAGVGGEQ